MKKIKLLSVLVLCFAIGVVGIKALDLTENLKLTEDLNETITIAADKTVTIDLNGHNITVTGAGVDAISNHGNLTITGTGKVSSEAGAIVNYPEGIVLINDGEYFSSGWYVIKNMGTMTINNLKFTNEVSGGASLIANGFYGSLVTDRYQVATADSVASLTINGGTFENKNNSCNVIKNDDYGVLVINGGTFIAGSTDEINSNPVVQNWHKATINDGTFTSKYGWVLTNGYYGAGSDIGEMTVNGGVFTGAKGLFATNGGAQQGKGVLTIKGGTFHGDATLSTVYATVIEGGLFDDEDFEIVPSEGFEAYEILYGENAGQTIVVKEDELEAQLSYDELDKEDIENEIKDILELYEKAQKGEIEYDEEDMEFFKLVKEFKETVEKYTVVGYYDIILGATTPDGYIVDTVDEPSEAVEVTLDLPETLPKVKTGYTRKYFVVRIHDGKITVIDDVKVNEDGTITFKSDKFSTYALAYKDVEEVKNADTYDGILPYVAISIITSIMLIGGVVYLKKRYN